MTKVVSVDPPGHQAYLQSRLSLHPRFKLTVAASLVRREVINARRDAEKAAEKARGLTPIHGALSTHILPFKRNI